jgi:hypothetical protein
LSGRNTYNHAKITYDNGNISVYVNDCVIRYRLPAFNFAGYLGFTAATGAKTDNHSIKNVTIYTDIPPSDAGSDQTICSGESVQIGTSQPGRLCISMVAVAGSEFGHCFQSNVQITNNNSYDSIQKYYVQTALSGSTGLPFDRQYYNHCKTCITLFCFCYCRQNKHYHGTPVTFTATPQILLSR